MSTRFIITSLILFTWLSLGSIASAKDPELLDWVSATAGYGFLTAYDRFVAPLSIEDQERFYREGTAVAELYGVQNKVNSRADFFAMMDKLAPRFEPHPINKEFLDIIQSGKAAPNVPRFLHRALARAAVSILPPLIRERLELGREYDLSFADRAAIKLHDIGIVMVRNAAGETGCEFWVGGGQPVIGKATLPWKAVRSLC